MGRSKDTPEVRAVLIQAFSNGDTDKLACAKAGISEDALSDWEKADPDFAAQIKRIREDKALQERIRIRKLKDEAVTAAILNLVAAAKNGDVSASRWIEEHWDGDITNKLEITQAEPVKIFITPEQQAATLEHINQVINSGN